MAISANRNDREYKKFKESTVTSGQVGVVVVNSDGTAVGGSGGGAATIADGADVTQGALADAAATAGGTGSVSAKLRKISTDIGTLAAAVTASIFQVNVSPKTSGGLTIYRNLDTQSTGVNIKNGAGQVYGWYIANNASSVRYVKLYNKATGPTVGSDTPVITLPIPANAATNVSFENGIPFALGIGIGGVTGVADNNSGAPTANDIITNLFYA